MSHTLLTSPEVENKAVLDVQELEAAFDESKLTQELITSVVSALTAFIKEVSERSIMSKKPIMYEITAIPEDDLEIAHETPDNTTYKLKTSSVYAVIVAILNKRGFKAITIQLNKEGSKDKSGKRTRKNYVLLLVG